MSRPKSGSTAVAAVNGVVAVVLLAIVAVLALVVNPPAPPGIAAFAPQAAKPITKAPQAQSATSGEGAGECGAGQVCDRPSATPSASAAASSPSALPSPTGPAKGVPSALQCYTWPNGTVTQTFDPQSPPCIASWDEDKGNGGATAPGVSATEIRVALPVTNALPSTWPGLKPIVDFMNTRFQLYGRQIKIEPFISQQANGQADGTAVNDPSLQRADGAQVAGLKVFAALDFLDPVPYSWSLPTYRDTLTKNKIVSVGGGGSPPYSTLAQLSAHAPYEWTYYPTIDVVLDSTAAMVCRQLVGKPAKYARDPAIASQTRKFAVVFPTDDDMGGEPPGMGAMLRRLAACGVKEPRVVRYITNDDTTAAAQTEQYRKLRADGYTSLIFFPYTGSQARQAPPKLADAVQYRPEWVTIGWNKYLTDIWSGSSDEQSRASFGVGVWNKEPQIELEFWHQAYAAAGGDATQVDALFSAPNFYSELLLLASGIQMAGPNLTPETFAEGLRTTTFPNPGAAAKPFYQATVGFGPNRPAMVQDLNGFWFDPRTSWRSYEQSNRGLNHNKISCYVGLGRRWDRDSWPAADGFYQGGCR